MNSTSKGLCNKIFKTETLEKTEGAIKNEQSRETGNIGYTRHKRKANKKKAPKKPKQNTQHNTIINKR
jgi:hypothetical protein